MMGGSPAPGLRLLILGTLATVLLIYTYGLDGMRSGGTSWAKTVAKMPFEMLDRNLNKLTDAQRDADAEHNADAAA